MAELPPFDRTKIEAFTSAMKYATRDNFSSFRQPLIDGVRRETVSVLRRAKKGGQVDEDIDRDGDLVFRYEHPTFGFRLDIRRDIAGAQFKDLYDHALAIEIVKTFYSQVAQCLSLRDVDVFSADFKNVFNLVPSAPKNYVVFQERLMPSMRGSLAPLLSADSHIGRLDFKLGWDCDDRRTCYFSIECPGNEENTTIWTTLNVRTREDILVNVDQQQLAEDLDTSYEIYCTLYSETVKAFLRDLPLDFERRQLIRR